MRPSDVQLTQQGELRHFLSIDGLSREHLQRILKLAESFASVAGKPVKKAPLLRGKTVVNLFFEPSTRTLTTFDLAAKRLSADVLNVNLRDSSVNKGESLLDTLRTFEAMHCDLFVIRHPSSGAAAFIASRVSENVAVINAGDGCHAHPTQAMLDMFTIQLHKPNFASLRVAIVGDIAHSRVARSEISALRLLGTRDIRVIGPRTLIPRDIECRGVRAHYDLEEGLRDADIVVALRLQREKMSDVFLPGEKEYFRLYGLNVERLEAAAPGALVMHPGPINRGVELDSSLADNPRSLILEQVSHGVAVRMAIMAMTLGAVQLQDP